MLYNDLREWITEVEKFGELRRVPGVDWDLEMGAITELYARNEPYPAILFDEIKDYPAGHSVLVLPLIVNDDATDICRLLRGRHALSSLRKALMTSRSTAKSGLNASVNE